MFQAYVSQVLVEFVSDWVVITFGPTKPFNEAFNWMQPYAKFFVLNTLLGVTYEFIRLPIGRGIFVIAEPGDYSGCSMYYAKMLGNGRTTINNGICRSRQELSLIAKIGVDTAENGLSKVSDRNLAKFGE